MRRTWNADRREKGQGLVEYALIVALVAIVAIAALILLGKGSRDAYETTLHAFEGSDTAEYLRDDFEGSSPFSWQSIWGAWQIVNGQLTSTDRWSKAVAALPGPDYTFSLDMQTMESNGSYIWEVSCVVFRFQNTDNYYAVVPKTDGNLELAKMQNGQWRPWLAWAPTGADPMKMHNYQVEANGNRIQVWMDGVKYIDYTDPDPIPDGGIGVTNDGSVGAIDNVEVRVE